MRRRETLRTCSADTVNVLRRGEYQRKSGRERGRRATHILNREREGLVDDELDLGDIESTRSDIYRAHSKTHQQPSDVEKTPNEETRTSRDENLDPTILEVLQTLAPLILRHVPLNAPDLKPLPLQELGDPRRLLLVQRKHKRLLPLLANPSPLLDAPLREPVIPEHAEESLLLLPTVGEDDGGLLDAGIGGQLVGADGDADRGAHKVRGELADARGPRGGEHAGLRAG